VNDELWMATILGAPAILGILIAVLAIVV